MKYLQKLGKALMLPVACLPYLLPERATVGAAFGIVEEGVQVAQLLLVDAAHHLNVTVFQFRIAQVGNTVV